MKAGSPCGGPLAVLTPGSLGRVRNSHALTRNVKAHKENFLETGAGGWGERRWCFEQHGPEKEGLRVHVGTHRPRGSEGLARKGGGEGDSGPEGALWPQGQAAPWEPEAPEPPHPWGRENPESCSEEAEHGNIRFRPGRVRASFPYTKPADPIPGLDTNKDQPTNASVSTTTHQFAHRPCEHR